MNRRYRKKTQRDVSANISVVEIDLLRSSFGRLEVATGDLSAQRTEAYISRIFRPRENPDSRALYPIPLRSPPPTITIPCRENDPEVPLSLQPLIDQIYIDGGHDDIDYSKPLREPLAPDDAKWATELIAAAR